jgi:hypothetical protein
MQACTERARNYFAPAENFSQWCRARPSHKFLQKLSSINFRYIHNLHKSATCIFIVLKNTYSLLLTLSEAQHILNEVGPSLMLPPPPPPRAESIFDASLGESTNFVIIEKHNYLNLYYFLLLILLRTDWHFALTMPLTLETDSDTGSDNDTDT